MFDNNTPFQDIDGVTTRDLIRTNVGGGRGEFRSAAHGLKLTISQNETKARRQVHQVRVDKDIVAADYLLSGVNRPYSGSIRLVMDFPAVGFSTADKENLLQGFAVWIATQANRDKLVNGES